MKWYLKVLNQYADFEGRARRKEYWLFALLNIVFGFVTGVIDLMLGTDMAWYGLGVVNTVYAMAVFVPALAVTVRRLHDTNRSGWMLLIAFIPFIGPLWLLILMAIEGNPVANQYGPNPKDFTTPDNYLHDF